MDERDTTCCYARQDKFWVQGAPDGERWEIYTVLDDSQTFWGEAGEQSWQAAEGALDAGPRAASAAALDAGQVSPCCGAAPEAARPQGRRAWPAPAAPDRAGAVPGRWKRTVPSVADRSWYAERLSELDATA